MAAVIGSRLLNHILTSIEVTHAVLWSDSQIVLNWLKSKKTLKSFVANRIKEIRELTGEFMWKYCPTDTNPADLLSRGVSADRFKERSLWVIGPVWLTDKDKLPKWNEENTEFLSTIAETESTLHVSTKKFTIHEMSRIIDIGRFNSLKKILRVTTYVQRFTKNCRSQKKQTGTLTPSEIQSASIARIQDGTETTLLRNHYRHKINRN